MLIPLSQQWPGASLSFFYFILVVLGAQLGVSADVNSSMSDMAESPNSMELAEGGSQNMNQPMARDSPHYLVDRDPRRKKVETVTETAIRTATITKNLSSNSTATLAGAMVTVTQTATVMMMMTVVSTQTVNGATPVSIASGSTSTVVGSQVQTLANSPSSSAAAASTTAGNAAAAAAPSSSGLASVLTLGFLSAAKPSTTIGGQLVEVVTEAPSTVFAIATETSTMFVEPVNIVATDSSASGMMDMSMTATGMNMMTMSTSSANSKPTSTETGLLGMTKSEAISGRQAGHRVGGFGAVVLAVAVAVIIL